MPLEKLIRSTIETKSEDYFLGTVDLSMVKNSLIRKYASLIAEYPRAISVGLTLPTIIRDELSSSKYTIYRETYCNLKNITSHLSNLLVKNGYKAISMPKSQINLDSDISFHEVVANLAEMGEIDKNSLVTPEVGSSVKWGTILTDAPINKYI
ncbi:MAG: 4Fe-4S ferredoxin [Methanobacterium sp.]|nr:4Fe-4S ferredoxin [Methanobacterium sp.]